MSRLTYSWARDVEKIAIDILSMCSSELGYIDMSRVFFVRSRGSRTSALARIHALPPVWRFILRLPAYYAIEVVSERYDPLSFEDKVYVILHELLHIPKAMGGGLRHHSPSFYAKLETLYHTCLRRLQNRYNP